MKEFQITLKEEHLVRISRALDFVSRLRCGGFEDFQMTLEEMWEKEHPKYKIGDKEWWYMHHKLEEHIEEIKNLVWKDLTMCSNKGIGYDNTSDSLFDMRKSMEKARYDAFDDETKELMRYTTMTDGPLGYDKDGEITVVCTKNDENQ